MIISRAFVLSLLTLALCVQSSAAVIKVNKSTGSPRGPIYNTINGAINHASDGDTVCITDSQNYSELLTINKNDFILEGAAGESPNIYGGSLFGSNTLLFVFGRNVTLRNLSFNIGGVRCGVGIAGNGVTITDCSFDVTTAARSSNTYAIETSCAGPTKIIACNFLGSDAVLAGGIIVNSASAAVDLAVDQCDFWGFGADGGMIGIGGIDSNSSIQISNSCFANGRYAPSGYEIVAINKWNGSISITERDNTFYNINTPLGSLVNNGVINSISSAAVSGNGMPANSNAVISMSNINNLLNYFGVPLESDSTLQPYTGPKPIGDYLSKAVWWIGVDSNYESIDPVTGLKDGPRAHQAIVNMGARLWNRYEISWGRQYNPADFQRIKTHIQDLHGMSPNVVCAGNLMECINKSAIENTSIPTALWCWMARWTRATAMRPLEVKTIGGRRIIAHFFDYDMMLGWGVDHWSTDTSCPNPNKQEGLMYYLFLDKSYIDAGMNQIAFSQPQLTFGQASIQSGYGGTNLQMISKFAKNYGLYRAPMIDGKRFVITNAEAVVTGLSNYCNFVDYVTNPAGTYSNGCGYGWNTLADSWNHIPASNLFLPGKPMCLELDNSDSENDHPSVFARTTPAERNAWLVEFTNYIKNNYGYYLMQPGSIPITPSGCQDFTGYTSALFTYPWGWEFLPYDIYSGCESTISKMFDPTNPPEGSISIESNAAYTIGSHVTLSLPATDAETCVRKMSLRNDDGEWGEWTDYKPTMAWTLASDEGTRTVSVRYQDYPGNISQVYSDTIVVDYGSPTGSISINSGAVYTESGSVTLTLSAIDSGVGVTQMRLQNYGYAWSDWEPFATTKTWTLPTGGGVKEVCVQYMDGAGNISAAYSDTIAVGSPISLADAKKQPAGSFVILSRVAVTAGFSDCAYIEDMMGNTGIKVTDSTLSQGVLADIAGTLFVSNGEKALQASIHSATGSALVKPLGIRPGCIGGGDWYYDAVTDAGQMKTVDGLGLNNIGLLVRVWGKFAYVNPTTFTVNDGSGTLECVVPSQVTLNQSWNYVGVTGISSTKQTTSGLMPQLRVRQQDDIVAF
ncbi:MAG: hypothetical protein ABFD54_06790 [Armatimonadota bacterium]